MRGRGVESVFTHYFYQSVQNKSVKSPFDMFDEPYTKSNDVMEVFEAITNYINGEK